jgi:UPF0716 family protein affecting phage T7 exclusion
MEGGIAILLALILLAVLGGAIFLFAGGRSAVGRARAADDEGDEHRPRHENPHPEQQRRERGRLFPESS